MKFPPTSVYHNNGDASANADAVVVPSARNAFASSGGRRIVRRIGKRPVGGVRRRKTETP